MLYWLDMEPAREEVRSIDAGVVSELEVLNKDNIRIGYWAYGYWDPTYPYQGEAHDYVELDPEIIDYGW